MPDVSINRTGISKVLKIGTNFQEAVIDLNFCDLVEKGAHHYKEKSKNKGESIEKKFVKLFE